MQEGKGRDLCSANTQQNMEWNDEDDMSNITFSGDEDCSAKVAGSRAPLASVRQIQSKTMSRIKKQQRQPSRLGARRHPSSVGGKQKSLLGKEPCITTNELATLTRATAAAALANEAQRLAQLRARAHWIEERNKPCYKGRTKLQKRRNNSNQAKRQPKPKQQWDCTAQPLVGEGILQIRNMQEREASALAERRERQLYRRMKSLERDETFHLEAKQAFHTRRKKTNMETNKHIGITTETNPEKIGHTLREELVMNDRCDGNIERTFGKIQITPSKIASLKCCCRTRSTSPFDENIVAGLINTAAQDKRRGVEATAHFSSSPLTKHSSDQDLLEERQLEALKSIEKQLEEIRLINEDECPFQLENLAYCYDNESRIPIEQGNLHNDSLLLVSEVVNETDVVSCITVTPSENNCLITGEHDFQISLHNGENISFSSELKQFLANRDVDSSSPEVLPSKLIEL